jgi:hypothetical protein
MAKQLSPNMQIRRLLLDGVKIVDSYSRAMRGSTEPALINERQLLQTWVGMARIVALKLKRAEMGKGEGHGG